MVDKFEVGKWYKLRDDYPELEYGLIEFEGRKTCWYPDKIKGFENGQIRKCVSVNTSESSMSRIAFEDIGYGAWVYNPLDFIEVTESGMPINEVATNKPYTGELKVGMRVRGVTINYSYIGTVIKADVIDEAHIKRDDGKTGSGNILEGYGKLWRAKKEKGQWYVSEYTGKLYLLDEPRQTTTISYEQNNSEEKMEIKNIKKSNLVEAKRQVEAIRKNAEIEYATVAYSKAIDHIDRLDREIKIREEERAEQMEIVKQYK